MRKKIELDMDLIVRLREKGFSWQSIANRFKVSRWTIQRRLAPERGKADLEVLSFAAKLQKLVAEAPDDYCRKEVNRTVHFLRTQQAASKDAKYQKIFASIESGAREIEEIAEDCNFSKRETVELLEELISQEKIIKRERGGVLNRGRKTKFHYYIKKAVGVEPVRRFDLSFPPATQPIPISL